jgi:hypothetical protein
MRSSRRGSRRAAIAAPDASLAPDGGAGGCRIKRLIFGHRISAWGCSYRLLSILPYRYIDQTAGRANHPVLINGPSDALPESPHLGLKRPSLGVASTSEKRQERTLKGS